MPNLPPTADLLRFGLLLVVAVGGFAVLAKAPVPVYVELPASLVYAVALGWGYRKLWGHGWPFYGRGYWSMPGSSEIVLIGVLAGGFEVVLALLIAVLMPLD